MKRIGLTQRVDIAPDHGERRDGLDQNWAGLLLALGYCPIPLANKVPDIDGYLAALALDGVILTGGNDLVEVESDSEVAPERDRFEHRLLDLFSDERLPVLGVCRGLQIMNIHYGGSLKRADGHVSKNHHAVLDQGFFSGCPDSMLVNSFHNFAIDQLGHNGQLRAVAWAEDGTIEAAAHESLPQFGVMWHPEREETLAKHDRLVISAAFGEGQP